MAGPERIVAIIPAAGIMANPEAEYTVRSDAMTSVAGKPAIFWTINYLITIGVERVVIAISDPNSEIKRFSEAAFNGLVEIEFIILKDSLGVGNTVLAASKKLERCISTLVVLGDTVLHPKIELEFGETSWAAISDVNEGYRWCMASLDGNMILGFRNKPRSKNHNEKALIGIYYFRSGISHIADHLFASIDKRPIEMSDLLEVELQSSGLSSKTISEWIDVGNPDHLRAAQASLLNVRSFNQLAVDTKRGTIRKQSTYESKFFNEIAYLILIPKELKIYFPRIVDHSLVPGKMFIEQEYYAYPTLSELFLYNSPSRPVWNSIFSTLSSILESFKSFEYNLQSALAEDVYIKKNRERVETILEDCPVHLKDLTGKRRIQINGILTPSLSTAFELSESVLKEICSTCRFTPIHGDLCFSNILCEPYRGVIKFIDPRGSFGQVGFVGDQRYDLAKLNHSAIGMYDYIVSDLVVSTGNDGIITQNFPQSRNMYQVQELFLDYFGRKSPSMIGTITAWLFLSMLPLHADSPRRQRNLAIRGLQLLAEQLK